MRTAFLMITILSLRSPVTGQDLSMQHAYSRKPIISSFEIYVGAGSAGLIGRPLPVFSLGNGTYGYPQLKHRPALVVGVSLNHELGKRILLTVRFCYETKGFIQQLDSITQSTNPNKILTLGTRYTETNKTAYYTFQVLPRLKLLSNHGLTFGLGPYASMLTSADLLFTSQSSRLFSTTSNYPFNKFEYGLTWAISYSFMSGKPKRIFVQAVGTYALSPLSDKYTSFGYPIWKNNTYLISLGYALFNTKRW